MSETTTNAAPEPAAAPPIAPESSPPLPDRNDLRLESIQSFANAAHQRADKLDVRVTALEECVANAEPESMLSSLAKGALWGVGMFAAGYVLSKLVEYAEQQRTALPVPTLRIVPEPPASSTPEGK